MVIPNLINSTIQSKTRTTYMHSPIFIYISYKEYLLQLYRNTIKKGRVFLNILSSTMNDREGLILFGWIQHIVLQLIGFIFYLELWQIEIPQTSLYHSYADSIVDTSLIIVRSTVDINGQTLADVSIPDPWKTSSSQEVGSVCTAFTSNLIFAHKMQKALRKICEGEI